MKILLDMDGVVCDFFTAALTAWVYDSEYPRGVWDIASVLGISEGAFWDRIDNEEFWSSLLPYPCARGFTESLGDVTICTKASRFEGCASAKVHWIHEHLGDYPYIIMGPGTSKAMLAGPDALLLDDNEPNVQDFQNAGGRAILVPRPWNIAGLDSRYDIVDYEELKWMLNGCVI